jgi:hypothetical protein
VAVRVDRRAAERTSERRPRSEADPDDIVRAVGEDTIERRTVHIEEDTRPVEAVQSRTES